MKFIKRLKGLWALSDRIGIIESEIKELDAKIKQCIEYYAKELESKIQQMTFDYTKNLDDTKSNYLKKYVETRMDCMQQELSAIPKKIAAMQEETIRALSNQND